MAGLGLIKKPSSGTPFPVLNNIAAISSLGQPSYNKIDVLGYNEPNDGGGGTFIWDSQSTDTPVNGMIIQVSGVPTGRYKRYAPDNKFNVRWFGAVCDGITDDTSAVNLAIDFIDRVGYIAGWGQAIIEFPQGEIRIDGTISASAAIGLTFKGVSQFGTVLKITTDDQVLFNLDIYINAHFQDLTIAHDTENVPETWSNTAFQLDGVGGGRMFTMERVTTIGFNRIVHDVATVNGDTNSHKDCTFQNCNTFLDSENAQGVINTYTNCTWVGAINSIWNVAGHWQTLVNSGNIVIDGVVLKYKNISGKYNDRGFTFLNTKLEFTSAHAQSNPVPKLIQADGVFITANVSFINCALNGGAIPHPDTKAISIINNAKCHLYFQGGNYVSKLEVQESSGNTMERANFIKLDDVSWDDVDSWIISETGLSGKTLPVIDFNNVREPEVKNKLPYNFIYAPKSPAYINPLKTSVISDPTKATVTYLANTSINHELVLPHGQNIMVDKLIWNHIIGTVNANEPVINVYDDASRTNLIATVKIPTGTTAGDAFVLPTNNNRISGIYVSVITPVSAAPHIGYLTAQYISTS